MYAFSTLLISDSAWPGGARGAAETLAAPLAGPKAVATAITHHAGGIQVGSLNLGRFHTKVGDCRTGKRCSPDCPTCS